MTAMLKRRGPDADRRWNNGPVGLGHTLLSTTPQLFIEPQPIEHPETGCVITADVRLDNREELIAALDIHRDPVGDAEIILGAYLKWGADCPNHLLGDFAFAIWDPRHKRVFCARDHSGSPALLSPQARIPIPVCHRSARHPGIAPGAVSPQPGTNCRLPDSGARVDRLHQYFFRGCIQASTRSLLNCNAILY